MLDAASLFTAHLDLAPLKHRATGLVRCIFHDDHTASLSVDLDRGLFHCFTCGAEGGVKAFAARVGSPSGPMPRQPLSPGEAAMRTVLRAAAHAAERRRPWLAYWGVQDLARTQLRIVAQLRRMVTALGDCPESWPLAEFAAALELETEMLCTTADDLQMLHGYLKGPDGTP